MLTNFFYDDEKKHLPNHLNAIKIIKKIRAKIPKRLTESIQDFLIPDNCTVFHEKLIHYSYHNKTCIIYNLNETTELFLPFVKKKNSTFLDLYSCPYFYLGNDNIICFDKIDKKLTIYNYNESKKEYCVKEEISVNTKLTDKKGISLWDHFYVMKFHQDEKNLFLMQNDTIFSFNLVTKETKITIKDLKKIAKYYSSHCFTSNMNNVKNHVILFEHTKNYKALTFLNKNLTSVEMKIKLNSTTLSAYKYFEYNKDIICLLSINSSNEFYIEIIDIKQKRQIKEIKVIGSKIIKSITFFRYPFQFSRSLMFDDLDLNSANIENFNLSISKPYFLLFYSLKDDYNVKINLLTGQHEKMNTTLEIMYKNNLYGNEDINDTLERQKFLLHGCKENHYYIGGNKKILLLFKDNKRKKMLFNDVLCSIGGCSDKTIEKFFSDATSNKNFSSPKPKVI